MSESGDKGSLGPVKVWALSAGGMVGGGIYIALGVVISLSVQWAWLSFLISGLVAAVTAYSYAKLSSKYKKSGGAFEFLEEIGKKGIAGGLSWLLILGYILTIALYIYAFGHYVAFAFNAGDLTIRILAISIGVGLVGLNLLGLGKMTSVEVVIVSTNLLVLLALAVYGLFHWNTLQLSTGMEPRSGWSSLVGAASIFVSYEGFQLLTYEYGKIKNADKTFTPILTSAAIFVVFTYILVALGAPMLAGALKIVEYKQVALSVAANHAWGFTGLVLLTIAAGFATAAAINSTLFSTGELIYRVAKDDELPRWFQHRNGSDVPARGIVAVGIIATLIAITGGLSSIVEAASLVFLSTFFVVNLIAARKTNINKALIYCTQGLLLTIGSVLIVRLALIHTIPLTVLVVTCVIILALRPLLVGED